MNPGRWSCVLAASVALALVGCSAEEATTLDRPATQAAVRKVVADHTGRSVAAVTCPEIPLGRAEEVTCTIDLVDTEGQVRARVRQQDDEGNLQVTLEQAILDREVVAQELASSLEASFDRPFLADCEAPGWVALSPTEPEAPARPADPDVPTLVCTASDSDGQRQVLVSVTDAAGTLHFEVQDPDGAAADEEPTTTSTAAPPSSVPNR